jgi:hypothetical protein
MVVVAIFQVATVYRNYVALTDAVRTGARTAAVSAGTADPTAAAVGAVVSAAGDIQLPASNVTVASTWQPGTTVTVQASYPFTLSLFGASVYSGSLTSQTTERVE